MSPERRRVALREPVRSARLLHPGRDEAALDAALARMRQAALEEGRAEGAERARREEAAALALAVERLETFREEAARALAGTAVELAIATVRELLRVEIPAGRYDLEAIVRDALEQTSGEREPCVVHLNPADAEALSGIPFRSGTTIQADADVRRGDVHVETPRGLLVRELDLCLRSIRERLREEIADA